MTTTTSSGLAALQAWFASALADRLPAHIARLDWRPDQLAEFQRSSLRALLRHAVEQSPFHAARLAAAGLTRADIDKFRAVRPGAAAGHDQDPDDGGLR